VRQPAAAGVLRRYGEVDLNFGFFLLFTCSVSIHFLYSSSPLHISKRDMKLEEGCMMQGGNAQAAAYSCSHILRCFRDDNDQ
jgi:hypothetical protein